MLKKIIMPAGGQTSSDGTIFKWNKKAGEKVKKWDVIVEIETDKSVIEIEASGSGIFLGGYYEEGEKIQAGTILGYFGSEGDTLPPKDGDASKEEPQAIEEIEEDEDDDEYAAIMPGEDKKEVKAEAVKEQKNITYKATPGAKKLAKEKGIDLSKVIPVNNVAIKKNDVENYKEASPSVGVANREATKIPTSSMRKVIAKRMKESLDKAATYHLITKVDMTSCLNTLNKINLGKEKSEKISINDVIMKAAILSVKKYPLLNATYGEEEITLHNEVHFGLAVAVDSGLVVPVLRDADLLSLKEIAKGNKENIGKIRGGKYSSNDISGSTITLSSLGSFGIYITEPIINYPESCIIGVGEMDSVLKMVDGKIEEHKEMCIIGGFDHRIVDGAEGAKFLKSLKEYLENLELMLIDLK